MYLRRLLVSSPLDGDRFKKNESIGPVHGWGPSRWIGAKLAIPPAQADSKVNGRHAGLPPVCRQDGALQLKALSLA